MPDNRLREAERHLMANPPQEMFSDMADQMAKNVTGPERRSFKAMMTKHLDVSRVVKANREQAELRAAEEAATRPESNSGDPPQPE